MASSRRRGNGDAPVAICQRTFCLRLTLVGARKKLTLAHLRVFRPIRVVRLVGNKDRYLRSVLTPANRSVMQGLAHPARIWGLCRFVSAARILRPVDASRPITILDGAAERFAETCYLVANTSVQDHAMKAFAALARYLLQPDATVARSRKISSALTKRTRSTVENKA
ncbi:hypothetical protein MMC10_011193 [Thelotrema lepadinum]|nr:hypothetical protein [Thelotrema lepadinum]